MEKESLIIENFGPIDYAEFNEFPPTALFYGKEGVGKTAAMKILRMFRDLYAASAFESFLENCGIGRNETSFTHEFVDEYGLFRYFREDSLPYLWYGAGSFSACFSNGEFDQSRYELVPKQISDVAAVYASDRRWSVMERALRVRGRNPFDFDDQTFASYMEARGIPLSDVDRVRNEGVRLSNMTPAELNREVVRELARHFFSEYSPAEAMERSALACADEPVRNETAVKRQIEKMTHYSLLQVDDFENGQSEPSQAKLIEETLALRSASRPRKSAVRRELIVASRSETVRKEMEWSGSGPDPVSDIGLEKHGTVHGLAVYEFKNGGVEKFAFPKIG